MTKQNYAIALSDVLGFSSLVMQSPLEDIVNDSLGYLAKACHHALHHGEFPETIPNVGQLENHPELGFAWFSDTILVYTRQDTDESVRSLLEFLGWLLFETMFTPDTHLRCAVSYGEAYIDSHNSLYVGRTIVDAYRLEREQAWSGGALTPEAVERLPAYARSGTFVDWYVVPYEIPVKSGGSRSTLAINWTIGIHEPETLLPWSATTPEPTAEDWIYRKDVCEKWYNTRAFHERVCRWCHKS